MPDILTEKDVEQESNMLSIPSGANMDTENEMISISVIEDTNYSN